MFYKDNELFQSSDTVNHPVGQITPGEPQSQMVKLLLITKLNPLSLAFLWTTNPCRAIHALKLYSG